MKNTVLTALLSGAILTGAAADVTAQNMGQMGQKSHMGQHGTFMDFDMIDTDGDGQLSRKEMRKQHEARYARFDSNGDKKISADEIRATMQAEANARIEARIARMMERHDADEDGLLSRDEIKPRRAGKMFRRFDANDDGMISRDEFTAMQDAHKMHRARKADKG